MPAENPTAQSRRLVAGLTETAWWLGSALTFWSCGYAVRRADDLWWHLAAGRWMLDHHALTCTDEFSFTAAGAPWLNDAWLADVLFAAWQRMLGMTALAWWKWTMVVATFLLLASTLRRAAAYGTLDRVAATGAAVGPSNRAAAATTISSDRAAAATARCSYQHGAPRTLRAVADRAAAATAVCSEPAAVATGAYVAATLGAVTAAPFLDMRPQLYSFLAVVLVLRGCVARPAPALWVPLVFLAWANLHAGFIFGLGCLAVLATPAVLHGGAARRRALLVSALALGCCLLNPHGAIALSRPLRYALDRSSPFHALAEWWPPFRPGGVESPLYPVLLGIFVAAALATVARRASRRSPTAWAGLALGATTLAMSLTSRRFVPLFAIVQGVALAPVVARTLAPLVRRLPPLVPALAALALGAVWLAPYPRANWAFHDLTAEDHFPVETANFIETNALSGNVFAQYAWAGYLQMRTHGRMKVYIDGRADAVYPDAVFVRYQRAAHGEPGWIDVIEDSAAEWVLWPRHLPWGALPRALLATGRWQQVHTDAVAVLLRRRDGAPAAGYAPTPDSPFRAYALGVLALDQGRLDEARLHLTEALARAPYLRRACNALALTELRAGNIEAGRATIGRCEHLFPIPARVAWFEEQIAALTPPEN